MPETCSAPVREFVPNTKLSSYRAKSDPLTYKVTRRDEWIEHCDDEVVIKQLIMYVVLG